MKTELSTEWYHHYKSQLSPFFFVMYGQSQTRTIEQQWELTQLIMCQGSGAMELFFSDVFFVQMLRQIMVVSPNPLVYELTLSAIRFAAKDYFQEPNFMFCFPCQNTSNCHRRVERHSPQGRVSKVQPFTHPAASILAMEPVRGNETKNSYLQSLSDLTTLAGFDIVVLFGRDIRMSNNQTVTLCPLVSIPAEIITNHIFSGALWSVMHKLNKRYLALFADSLLLRQWAKPPNAKPPEHLETKVRDRCSGTPMKVTESVAGSLYYPAKSLSIRCSPMGWSIGAVTSRQSPEFEALLGSCGFGLCSSPLIDSMQAFQIEKKNSSRIEPLREKVKLTKAILIPPPDAAKPPQRASIRDGSASQTAWAGIKNNRPPSEGRGGNFPKRRDVDRDQEIKE